MDNLRILVATDFSSVSDQALERALALARREPSAQVHVVFVMEKVDDLGQLDIAAAELQRALDAIHAHDICRTFVHVRVGVPELEILKLAADIVADLIVVGTHGRRGLSRLWIGSVAERVMRLASCPVLAVRPVSYQPADPAVPIEPPCPQCIIARTRSEGREWWCATHATMPEPHRYGYTSAFDQGTKTYNQIW